MGTRMGDSVVLITGGPGSGKSSAVEALGTRLEVDGVRYGAIETELLGWGWPWLSLEESLAQLRAIIALQREAGRSLFLIVATTETEAELQGVLEAAQADRSLVICLAAPPEIAAHRVADREPDSWPGKAALVEHARERAAEIPRLPGIDRVLSTERRSAIDVAAEIHAVMRASWPEVFVNRPRKQTGSP
jgi:predicted kinase